MHELLPKQTKALVVSHSTTVNPAHGVLVLSGVSIRATPNLDILGKKFDIKLTFEGNVRGSVLCISSRTGTLMLVKLDFVGTSV